MKKNIVYLLLFLFVQSIVAMNDPLKDFNLLEKLFLVEDPELIFLLEETETSQNKHTTPLIQKSTNLR